MIFWCFSFAISPVFTRGFAGSLVGFSVPTPSKPRKEQMTKTTNVGGHNNGQNNGQNKGQNNIVIVGWVVVGCYGGCWYGNGWYGLWW
jgi:hypothetical protein